MLAASFWSLISPALEITEKIYGTLAFLPVVAGLAAGGFFVAGSEFFLAYFGVCAGGAGISDDSVKEKSSATVVETSTTYNFLRLNKNVAFFRENLRSPTSKNGQFGAGNAIFNDVSSLEMKKNTSSTFFFVGFRVVF
uniref:Uncharacterized protein n=1 Tax=Romanomermis culicivorax TaxID=13658 RepID=A0A915I9Q7_ROMCU